MMPLLRMTDKRQMVKNLSKFKSLFQMIIKIVMLSLQELTNPEQKKRLLAALSHVKKYLPSFTASMQAYIKSPSAESKVHNNSSSTCVCND